MSCCWAVSPAPVVTSPVDSVAAAAEDTSHISMRSLIPTAKTVHTVRHKREVAHAKIITASPYKRKSESQMKKRSETESETSDVRNNMKTSTEE